MHFPANPKSSKYSDKVKQGQGRKAHREEELLVHSHLKSPVFIVDLSRMVSSCTSTRCHKCGKRRRPLEDIISMRDSSLMDSELVEALWSPLEPSKALCGVQLAPMYTPTPESRTIIIDLVTKDAESDDSPASPSKREDMDQQALRKIIMSEERRPSMPRLMQNFARGMAAAFGTHITIRPRSVGKKACLNDFDLVDLRASRSFLQGVLPSGPRIRHFFSRIGGESVPLSLEQRPLAPDHHGNSSPYYPVIPNSFLLRY